jgi:hypothetical protein
MVNIFQQSMNHKTNELIRMNNTDFEHYLQPLDLRNPITTNDKNHTLEKFNGMKFVNPLNLNGINSLFELMQRQEKNYSPYLKNLNLLMFEDLTKEIVLFDKKSTNKRFEKEIEQYLIVEDDKIHANRHFFDHLRRIGNEYTTDRYKVTTHKMNLPKVIFSDHQDFSKILITINK